MSINGEKEARVARDGDKAEPVTVVSSMRSLKLNRLDLELTLGHERHSLRQEGLRDHRDSDPYH